MTDANILGVLDMPARSRELRHARRWLHDVVTADHAEIGDDVVLLGCELATNAIRYSDSVKLTIIVLAVDDAIRVEVIDAGSDVHIPRIMDPGLNMERGRGLQMVNEITQGRWGTHADENGRVVWFERPFKIA
ncbi:ATP-binding protein [Actinoallomurus sp. NBC_01490]|uniref:ATP-binding protein n=1 Tax=Actinoallomurus sp. NBC_01490 TaxID=2903557 RepID=UPI002E30CB3C|nr:ATP-binding protein [Actinoallomurus sp. NBC_01490]